MYWPINFTNFTNFVLASVHLYNHSQIRPRTRTGLAAQAEQYSNFSFSFPSLLFSKLFVFCLPFPCLVSSWLVFAGLAWLALACLGSKHNSLTGANQAHKTRCVFVLSFLAWALLSTFVFAFFPLRFFAQPSSSHLSSIFFLHFASLLMQLLFSSIPLFQYLFLVFALPFLLLSLFYYLYFILFCLLSSLFSSLIIFSLLSSLNRKLSTLLLAPKRAALPVGLTINTASYLFAYLFSAIRIVSCPLFRHRSALLSLLRFVPLVSTLRFSFLSSFYFFFLWYVFYALCPSIFLVTFSLLFLFALSLFVLLFSLLCALFSSPYLYSPLSLLPLISTLLYRLPMWAALPKAIQK